METIDSRTLSLIKHKSGLSFSQSKDYALLSALIQTETGEHISDNTLRRLMGVKNDAGVPRVSTLDVVARYLGFDSWELYLKFGKDQVPDSRFISDRKVVASSQITPGQMVEIYYHPNRNVLLEYQGEEVYIVKSVSGGSLHENDQLKIFNFVEGMTLFVSDVIRDGKSLGQYIAGEVSGLLSVNLIS